MQTDCLRTSNNVHFLDTFDTSFCSFIYKQLNVSLGYFFAAKPISCLNHKLYT